jgi:hypothetical protein
MKKKKKKKKKKGLNCVVEAKKCVRKQNGEVKSLT